MSISISEISICASSMSLMAAGVPIKSAVAGISAGLVTGDTDDDYLVLTDIQGLEDFFGDMDFKVAGTHKGITAIQMDIKIHGLTRPIIEEAIARTKQARTYILDEVMAKTIEQPRPEVGSYAPKIRQTLIEAIAVAYGFNPEGGTMNYRFSTFDDVAQLSSAIRMVKGYRRAKSNYFFRAESFLIWPVKRKITGT